MTLLSLLLRPRLLAAGSLIAGLLATATAQTTLKDHADTTGTELGRMSSVLYGAAYYNEYMPAQLQPGRLDKDIALMKAAGLTVVRMGESTWSLWEPEDGKFDYAWMDRIVDAMGKAGIR